MSHRRSVAFIPVAVGALLGGLGVFSVSAAPPATDASEVSHWNQVAATTLVAFPGPNGGAPPAFQINMGMVQGAVYDAVNAIGKKQHQPYLLKKRAGAKASIDAAVATAAYDVLSALVSTAPERAPFPGRAGLLDTLSSEYAASLDAIDDGASKRQGIAVGHAAAKAMLDARVGDGRFGPSQWVQNSGRRTLAAAHQSRRGSRSSIRPHGWAAWSRSSSRARRSSAACHRPRSTARSGRLSSTRSRASAEPPARPGPTEQTYIAKWWQSAPGPELERSRPAAHRPERPRRRRQRETPRAAEPEWGGRGDQLLERQVPLRLLAAVERDHHDVGRWERRTPTTDPTWTALITAPYPEWVSGHNCLDAAHVAVLRLFFGDAPGSFQITSTFRESRRTRGAHVRHVLAADRRAHRGTHLGWPPLSQRGRGRARCSAGTSPATGSRTTSSRWATDHSPDAQS